MKLFDKILLGALVGGVFTFSPGGFFEFILFLSALYLINKYMRTESRSFLIKLFILGFALRVILAFADYSAAFFVMHKGVDTQPDAVIYNNNAYYISHILKGSDCSYDVASDPNLGRRIEIEKAECNNGLPKIGSYQHGVYVFMLGFIYSWFGYCPIAMKVLNCLFGALSAILAYSIARRLSGSEQVSKISAAIVMFFPSTIYWSVTLLRDTIANSIFLAYMLSLLIYIKSGGKKTLIFAFISVIVLCFFKEKASPTLILGLIFVLIANFSRKIFHMRRLTAFIAIICLFAMAIGVMLESKFVFGQLNEKVLSVISHHRSYSAGATASTYKIFKESLYEKGEWSLRDFLDISIFFSIFKALAYFFLSPFPWSVPYNHPGLLIFYPQVILTFIILPFMFFGLLVSARRSIYLTTVFVATLVLIIVPHAIAEGIVGIAVRHRDMFTPFLIIFASYGCCSLMAPKNIPK